MSNTDNSFGNLVRYMFDRALRFLVFRAYHHVKLTRDINGHPVADDGLSVVQRCDAYVFGE